jgi:polysaccharide deacetylase 2 family uncharacterized protein YibQ
MASQSKKTDTKSSRKRKKATSSKTSAKKPQSRKRKVKRSKKASPLKRNIFIVLVAMIMASLVAFGYFLGQNDRSEKRSVKQTEKKHTVRSIKKEFAKLKTTKPRETHRSTVKRAPSPVVSEQPVTVLPKIAEVNGEEERVRKEPRLLKDGKVALAYRGQRPKLVIIIDDVHTKAQLRAIKDLKFPVTPSIFPPYELTSKSHLLAKGLKHYMVHLPMESGNKKFNRQYKTLKTSFSKGQMEERVKEIRRLFPAARYVNNHTGSLFTANYRAMKMLYAILKKEGFVFIDSRTSGRSKVKKIAHEFGDAYVARDVFIDNVQSVPAIHKQLKKAVRMARKKGYAIAIGHPYAATIRALAGADKIFNEVELVYIDDIYQK